MGVSTIDNIYRIKDLNKKMKMVHFMSADMGLPRYLHLKIGLSPGTEPIGDPKAAGARAS